MKRVNSGDLPNGAGFYRGWSSRAAEMALTTTEPQAQRRCSHSANMWTLIADAIEAEDKDGLAHLTANLVCFAP